MKKNLLLLHGALGASSQFKDLAKILRPYFDIYTFDFEGHGKNNSDNEFSIGLFTINLVDFIAKNKLEDINIFGYSMGGYVALNYVSKHSNTVEKIITLGTKYKWNPESSKQEAKMLNIDLLREKALNFVSELKNLHGTPKWEKVVNKTREMILSLGDNPVLEDGDLSKIKCKTQVCLGELDKMVSLEESLQIVNNIEGADFLHLNQTKHPIDKVDVSYLSEIIKEFIL
ncbi:MAG: 2-succinyl-6-hydroxy-2,4-cyclohexadiene-1-carboxylate synthase [Candidatus Kapaibacteriales bacterium]